LKEHFLRKIDGESKIEVIYNPFYGKNMTTCISRKNNVLWNNVIMIRRHKIGDTWIVVS
jgi:hypothetical protein